VVLVIQVQRQLGADPHVGRLGRILGPANLSAQVIAAYNRLAQGGIQTRTLAQGALQFVGLSDEIIGRNQRLELLLAVDDGDARMLHAWYRLRRC
jgi:hypothetical protein